MIRSKTLFEFRLFVCATAMIFVPSPTLAQDGAVIRAIPDPAIIKALDVTPTGRREDYEDGNEYFYFHKAGASFEQAYADIDLPRAARTGHCGAGKAGLGAATQ